MDTKAQPCLPLDVFCPGVKNLAVGPPVQWEHGLPPLAAHRCTGPAIDEQETKAEVSLLCVLSFACCFLQQTHMKLMPE